MLPFGDDDEPQVSVVTPRPLPAAPTGSVSAAPLPPPPAKVAAAAPLPGAVPAAPGSVPPPTGLAALDPARQPVAAPVSAPVVVAPPPPTAAVGAPPPPVVAAAPAPTGNVEVGRTDLLGGWTIAAAGDQCQLFMTLTTWSGGYRASTKGCNNDALKNISAWNMEGRQVQLLNDTGATVARLFPASKTQFNGQTDGGGPVSVSRS